MCDVMKFLMDLLCMAHNLCSQTLLAAMVPTRYAYSEV